MMVCMIGVWMNNGVTCCLGGWLCEFGDEVQW